MELDPLRDDAREYAHALRTAGVTVCHIECVPSSLLSVAPLEELATNGQCACRYPGVTHGFHYGYPAISAAVKVRADLVQGIRWLLEKEV